MRIHHKLPTISFIASENHEVCEWRIEARSKYLVKSKQHGSLASARLMASGILVIPWFVVSGV